MKALIDFATMIVSIGVTFYKAMVFMFFFNWFVATTFPVDPIGYWLSFALILTLSVLTMKGQNKSLLHYQKNKMKDGDSWAFDIANLIGVFVALNLALFIGWLIHLNI